MYGHTNMLDIVQISAQRQGDHKSFEHATDVAILIDSAYLVTLFRST
jgi:hypothetical protein